MYFIIVDVIVVDLETKFLKPNIIQLLTVCLKKAQMALVLPSEEFSHKHIKREVLSCAST